MRRPAPKPVLVRDGLASVLVRVCPPLVNAGVPCRRRSSSKRFSTWRQPKTKGLKWTRQRKSRRGGVPNTRGGYPENEPCDYRWATWGRQRPEPVQAMRTRWPRTPKPLDIPDGGRVHHFRCDGRQAGFAEWRWYVLGHGGGGRGDFWRLENWRATGATHQAIADRNGKRSRARRHAGQCTRRTRGWRIAVTGEARKAKQRLWSSARPTSSHPYLQPGGFRLSASAATCGDINADARHAAQPAIHRRGR